jgi:hypothetical protein
MYPIPTPPIQFRPRFTEPSATDALLCAPPRPLRSNRRSAPAPMDSRRALRASA